MKLTQTAQLTRLENIPKKEDRKLIYLTIDPRQYALYIKLNEKNNFESEIKNYCQIIRDNLGKFTVQSSLVYKVQFRLFIRQ